MYAPIFTKAFYSQSKLWHRVNQNAPTRAACNPHAILDHEKSQADLPEGAVLCMHCARRAPYLDRAGSYKLDELLAGMTEENLHGEVRPDSAIGNEFPNGEPETP